ncbi:MAG: cytochrome c [Edaphobacter sp.]|uniref:c-type cytochrome n=1 Tax=Edaphobacter sp. TaxID=1934404 RepID=UPI0023871EF6|nr:cytochrome c [Edaphobacter sp.]MDE1177483.1 cytochrome c [Edaphobacter sp.]
MRDHGSIVSRALCVLLLGGLGLRGVAYGQQAPPKAAPARPPSYPVRAEGDPAKIERGKQTFSANCSFCHGSDARGGETGPNLVRSQIVLDDKNGELIGEIIKNGLPGRGMPPISIDAEGIENVVAFLHSLQNVQRGMSTAAPIDILVGDAGAGETYFKANCVKCHSATGDFAGIGGKYPPKTLQNLVVSGGGGQRGGGTASHVPPTMAVVTLASGEKVEGRLARRDAFFVSVITADGSRRTFPLEGTKTKVEVKNPLQAHLDMLPKWTDSDIHNVTRYLSTLK